MHKCKQCTSIHSTCDREGGSNSAQAQGHEAGLSSCLLHPAGLHLLEQALQRPWAPHLLENLRDGARLSAEGPFGPHVVQHTPLYDREASTSMLVHLIGQDLKQRMAASP